MELIPCLNRSRRILSHHCVGGPLLGQTILPDVVLSVAREVCRVVNLELDTDPLYVSMNGMHLKLMTSGRGLVGSVRSGKHKLLPSASTKEDLEGAVIECAVFQAGDAFS